MGSTAKKQYVTIKNDCKVIPFRSKKATPSVFLAIFNDIVNLKNAVSELKNVNIKLKSISIGKPELSELEKYSLPKDKVYAFFTMEKINTKIEKTYQSIIAKYNGLVFNNRIVIN